MASATTAGRFSIVTMLLAFCKRLWVKAVELYCGDDYETVKRSAAKGQGLYAKHGLRGGLRRAATDRGQSNVSGMMINVMVAAILGVGVAIPVILDVINDSNISGTTLVIVTLIPVMLGVLLIVAVARPIMTRM